MLRVQAMEEVLHRCLARVALQLGSSEAIDFVAVEPELSISGNHLGVLLRLRHVAIGVVLLTVDLDHDALVRRQQQKEIHPLPR